MNHVHNVKMKPIVKIMLVALLGLTHVQGCQHALDWEKKSAEYRAAKAPIVTVGYVVKSYKDTPTNKTTYEVDFKILRILKGEELISALPKTNWTSESIYRITNFGSMLKCFADVNEEHVFMLFLTISENRLLKAYYSDLFGAAEVWTMEMEDRVIQSTFGFLPWADWTACSQNCGPLGTQQRFRERSRTGGKCQGHNTQKRMCNYFPCSGVKDIVKLANFESMPRGVITLNTTDQAIYDLTPNFYGQISAAGVFSPLWPYKFSVMGRVRPRKTKYPREGQYLFSLADASGRQYLGVKVFPSPTIEILHSSGLTSVVSLPLPHENINDGEWHQFAFGVHGTNISMFYNCLSQTVRTLPAEPFIPNVFRSTMIIGTKMFSMDKGADERFEGALSQLVITADPMDAEKQCQPIIWGETVQPTTGNSPRQSSAKLNAPSQNNFLDHWEWSSWSSCSTSCGYGVKVRKPTCLDAKINVEDCIPYYVPRTHEKQCFMGRCPECRCKNGGVCQEDDVCQCPSGWTGKSCETAICESKCENGGTCVSPGKCVCGSGWTGKNCSEPVCFPLCRNGGKCIGYNQCLCPSGYSGMFCTNRTDTILCISKCRNGGVCVGLNKCSCAAGWKGKKCHKPAAACNPPCANGGSCRGNNRCKCTTGFSGPTCESDVCGGCRNGGSCDSVTKTCKCAQGFTGQVCQYEVKEELCIRNPCQNVGQCIAFDTCYCPEDWFGLRCEYRKK